MSYLARNVLARYRTALVMPPRQVLSFVGKFEVAFKRLSREVLANLAALPKVRDKYPDGDMQCKGLLKELGVSLNSLDRELREPFQDVEWAVDIFQQRVKEQGITKLRDTDALPSGLVRALDKFLRSPIIQLQKSLDPHHVADAIRDNSDYEWNEKYEEGVSPEFVQALRDTHELVSELVNLAQQTHAKLEAFTTGDVKPEKIETLYHASVKGREIYQNGFKAETPKDQIGLGGSQSTKGEGRGISFTYDLKAALDIARSFKEAAMIATGQIKASTILDWGVRESKMDDFIMHLKSRLEKSGFGQRVTINREGGRWVVKEDDREEGRMIEKGVDQIFASPYAVFEVYDAYLWSHPSRLNPVHMNRKRLVDYLKDADPKDIGVVAAEVDMTNPDILALGGEREFRVPPSAVRQVTRFYA